MWLAKVSACTRRVGRTAALLIGSHPGAAGNISHMVDDTARDRAIYHALKAADEVAAALQAHLIEEHGADPDRTAARNRSTNSLRRCCVGRSQRAGRLIW